MKAMILAAGFGSRLRPLTHTLPKPLFPILNRPLLEHTIRLLKSFGIDEIVINLHHLPELITNYFGTGKELGVQIHWSPEDAILGTAGGIKKAQKYLEDDSFIVINSDVVVNLDLNKLIKYHRENNATATLVLKPGDSPELCDPIEVDEQNRIVHMTSMSSLNTPEYTNRFTFTGIQILEPEIFSCIPTGKFYGTTSDVFPEMIEDGETILAYPYEGYWADIGRIESYLQVHKDLLDEITGIRDLPKSLTPTQGKILPPVFVGKNCQISKSSKIGPYAIIGNNCIVDDEAKIENSVCWDNSILSHGSEVSHSVIAQDAIVGVKERVLSKALLAK